MRGIQNIYSPEELEKYYRLREERKKPRIEVKPKQKVEEKPKPEEKPKTEAEKPKLRESTTIDLVGRKIRIYMENGETIEGTVVEVAKYDMIIDCGGRKLIVFKHSMKKIEL